jgi:hypothetical protein
VAAVFEWQHTRLAVATSRRYLSLAWSYLEPHLKWCTLMVLIVVKCLVQPITVPITCRMGLRAIGTVLISKFITQEVYENHIDPMTRRWKFCMLW